MAWFVNPWAGVGYALIIVAWSVGVFLVCVRNPTRQTRTLASLLIAEGFVGAGGSALIWSTPSATDAWAWQITGMVAALLAAALYLAFLSTIPTPLTRPLRDPRVRGAVLAATVGLCAFLVLHPDLLVRGMFRVWWDAWEPLPGDLWTLVWTSTSFVSIFGFLAAWDARRRTADGTEARRRATFYLAAFGVRDIAWAVGYLTSPLWFHKAGVFSDVFILVAIPGASLAFSLLLAYGVLRAQLFDIDLRIKWTLRRGALATAFVAAFFVATAIAEQYLQEYGKLIGGAAVGFLLFALRPIERAADRFANAAMPGVQDSEEYRLVRKRAVYRAAIEGALEDGAITDKERAVLARLADELGIGATEALAVEREAHSHREASRGAPVHG